jgi:cytochrome b pre-mRNA-processing protein 3
MLLRRLIRPGPAKASGARLYAAAVAQARQPWLYARLKAPDTADGRFEIYTLHVLLVLERLGEVEGRSGPIGQAFFDAYLSGLDHGLRELAVGDLSVGKTMRRLGEAFYGRGRALQTALAALPDRTELVAFLNRTVFAADAADEAGPLADYVVRARDGLGAQPPGALAAGELAWPSDE